MLADDPPPTVVGPRDSFSAHVFSDCHASNGNVAIARGPNFGFQLGRRIHGCL
jgi:hypothetical protein